MPSNRDSAGSTHGAPLWLAADFCVPLIVLCAIAFLCWLWPVVYPVPSPIGGDVLHSRTPPLSDLHLLGTDLNGNDVWSRLLHGGRTSLLIAITVNFVGFAVGGFSGALAGYLGGVVDSVTMRTYDMFIAFPSLVFGLLIAQGLGPGVGNTILAISFYSVPAFARVARAAALRIRGRHFVLAARLSGRGHLAVLLRHIAPNIVPQLITFAILGMGIVIVVEGALSFLGLGVPAPAPSWGNMIFHGQQALLEAPHLALTPCMFLVSTVLSLNVLSETLRLRWTS